MKTLYEGILSDIDIQLDKSDELFRKAEREFNNFKKRFANKSSIGLWRSWTTSMGSHVLQTTLKAPNICKIIGVKAENKTNITIHIVNAPHVGTDAYSIGIYVHDKEDTPYNGRYYTVDYADSNYTEEQVFKTLKTQFKTIDDLIKLLKEN